MSLAHMLSSGPRQAKDRMCHKYSDINDQKGQVDVTDKVVVITGANGGMGRIVASQMAKRGAVVVLACRNIKKADEAVEDIKKEVPEANLRLVELDLSSMESVKACAGEITDNFPAITLLINNAGIMMSTPQIERTAEGFERHLATNYLGHALLTLLLVKQLKAGAPGRIVFVSSFAAEGAKLDPEDLNWTNPKKSLQFLKFGPYNDSKRLINLFVRELSSRLEGTGVNVYSLCPGIASTGLQDNMPENVKCYVEHGFIPMLGCSPEEAATTIMYCALSLKCANESGFNYHYEQRYPKADRDVNVNVAKKIWVATGTLLGMSFDPFFEDN